MALTGIEIYKYLPKTNCKKCGFPTCLAFAMKVSQKAVGLNLCVDLSPAGKTALEAASRPPIQLVTIGADKKKIQVGNETVLFRHDKTFFHPPALLIRLKDSQTAEAAIQKVKEVASYTVERVGMQFGADGFALENSSSNPEAFVRLAEAVSSNSELPLVLISKDLVAMEKALEKVSNRRPLIHAATRDNASQMAGLAKKFNCPLAVRSNDGLSELAGLVEQVSKEGIEEIVLDPDLNGFGKSLNLLTQIRRLALKKNFKLLGYPVISFPGEKAASVNEEIALAGQQIAKYGGIIVLENFSPASYYPLLTLRLNIYTDPQKPIQMQPNIYQIGTPKATSPVCITTNFSLTYFSIAGELESSGFPSWLVVCDTEGLSVLTSWAAGKFDAEKIAKTIKQFNVASNVSHKTIIIPGHVAILKGELEEAMPEWKILVGPREAVDVGGFLKKNWQN